jgi:hypothetical protein
MKQMKQWGIATEMKGVVMRGLCRHSLDKERVFHVVLEFGEHSLGEAFGWVSQLFDTVFKIVEICKGLALPLANDRVPAALGDAWEEIELMASQAEWVGRRCSSR